MAASSKSIAFVHTDDVDDTAKVDAKPINAAMEECVRWALAALNSPTGTHSDVQTRHMRGVLASMRWTHRAIRKALGWEEKPMAVDALALARIPLEGLYSLCLMIEDPMWVDRYLQDGWKKQYVRFLLQREETKNLPRFKEFNEVSGPKELLALQGLLGITDEQRATIDFDELGATMPSGMNRSEILRFPTPGRVIGRIRVPERKRLLERLYPEYEWLCSFAHGLPDAVFYKTAYDEESGTPNVGGSDPAEIFHRRVAEPAYLASLLSIVQAATELITLYPHDVNLAASVVNAWKEISHGALLGRAMWEIRSKSLLGVIGPS